VGSPLLGALASARERVALLVRGGLGVSAERGSLVLGGGFAAGRCEGFVAWWRGDYLCYENFEGSCLVSGKVFTLLISLVFLSLVDLGAALAPICERSALGMFRLADVLGFCPWYSVIVC
jgi:hypothetical protein